MNMQGNKGGQATGVSSPEARTVAFVIVGFAILLVGSFLQATPSLTYRKTGDEGQASAMLFPDLSDASKAASLAITTFDEDTASLRTFKVVKSGGVWVLPSHENYPADARDHLAAAATELIDRPILDVVSTSPGDHETYGVIEPDAEKVKVGETGVGQLVEIRDASGTRLARLVVGKEDKRPLGMESGGRALRFVRRAGQDPVYRVELDTSKFTTKFDDWIEKDLLKLSPWDVCRLTLVDSTASFDVDPAAGLMVSQDRVARIELSYDDKNAAWSLVTLVEYDAKDKPVERPLAEKEELASAKLNTLRNALGDLKIVDVARKPAGLSAELKADEKFTGDREAVLSLAQRGFFPFQTGEILSSSGETVVGMKDGVEYLLRFGNRTSLETPESAAPEGDKPAQDKEGRYLFVLARVNESLIDKPELKPLPAASEEATAKESDETSGDALAKADEEEAKAQAAIEERRRVERENRLAQEAYDEKVKGAHKRVRELNARFADWYYVVSESEYAKIRLGEPDVITAKSDDKAAASPLDPVAPVDELDPK